MIPALPAGSRIRVEPAGDGYHLEWRPPLKPGARGVAVVILVVWLVIWGFALVATAGVLVKPSVAATARIVVLVWLVLWSLGGLAALRSLREVLAKPPTERLALGRAELRWTPARPRTQIRPRHGVRRIPGEEVIVHRAAVRDIQIEERTVVVHGRTPVPRAARLPRPALRLVAEDGVYGPGWGLSPDETRWLGALLQAWWKS